MQSTFLGESYDYWFELKKRADELGVDHLLRDLAKLSAKVNYYETQIKRLNDFRESVNKL
jgi:hypothetical protein